MNYHLVYESRVAEYVDPFQGENGVCILSEHATVSVSYGPVAWCLLKCFYSHICCIGAMCAMYLLVFLYLYFVYVRCLLA